MTWVLGIGAAVCTIYYIVIVIYSGLTTSFAFIWLFFAALLGLLAGGRRYYHMNPGRVPLWIPVAAVTVCVTGLVVFFIVEILIFMGAASNDKQNLDYLIVLGARVKETHISNSLKKRLDKAIEYLEDNPDTILVLSGGQGPDEPFTEAQAMFDYLTFNGVPKEQMILETYSTSTVENIAYSRVVIEQDREERKKEAMLRQPAAVPGPSLLAEDKPVQIGLLTSDFHVYRAKQIARKWGFPSIYGIASGSDLILFPHFCVRECAAILKDKLMGNM